MEAVRRAPGQCLAHRGVVDEKCRKGWVRAVEDQDPGFTFCGTRRRRDNAKRRNNEEQACKTADALVPRLIGNHSRSAVTGEKVDQHSGCLVHCGRAACIPANDSARAHQIVSIQVIGLECGLPL